ncbi:MAG: hypothetical protein ACPH5P_00360 [Akkermansiaceae bacterium]
MAKNYTLVAGSSCKFEHRCKNVLDQPVDLTGYSIEASLKDRPDSPVLLNFTVDVANPTQGLFYLTATPAETSTLSRRRSVYYDIKFTRPDSSVHYSPRIEMNIKDPITN